MIRATAGAELCASHDNPNPKQYDCAKAIDQTYQGDVDLSTRVVVGDPVRKSDLHWSVPYNVKDDAGNEAVTVWRDVVVKEVDLASVEKHVRQEMLQSKDAEIKKAVQKAIREERVKWDREQKSSNSRTSRRNTQDTCPSCPPCECSSSDGSAGGGVVANPESCRAYCDNTPHSCIPGHDTMLHRWLDTVEGYLPPTLFPMMAIAFSFFMAWLILKFCATVFNPNEQQSYDYGRYGDAKEAMILQGTPDRTMQSPPPPKQSISAKKNDDSFFSPQTNGGGMQSPQPSATNNGFGFSSPQQRPQYNNGFTGNLSSPPPPHQQQQPWQTPAADYLNTPIIPDRDGNGVTPRRSATRPWS